MRRWVIFCLAFVMLFAFTVGATVTHATETSYFSITRGEDTFLYHTLKGAMDDAVDGDTILVLDSTTVDQQATVSGTKRITLQAAEGVDPVLTRDTTFTGSLIVVESGASLTVKGITLDGGAGSDSFAPDLENAYEGHANGYFAIPVIGNTGLTGCDPIISTSGTLVVEDSAFRNNYLAGTATANKNGGAVNVAGGSATFTKTAFTHNLACWGSAIYSYGANALSLEACTFEKNFAVNIGRPTAYESGGTVYIENTAATTVDDCDFTDNAVSIGNGGGIYVKNTNAAAASLTVNDSDFIGNAVGNDGFAIQVNNNVTTSFSRCTMKRNTGLASPQSVAAMSYMKVENYCRQEITECTFEENNGPVSCIGNHGSTAVIDVKRSTFQNNKGNNLAYIKSSSTSFTDCTFVSNKGELFACSSEIVASDTVPTPKCTIANCTIKTNEGTHVLGAGIAAEDATPYIIEIKDSQISGNAATGYGTIYGTSGTHVTITDSIISDNSSYAYGGAVYANNATLIIERSSLTGNETTVYGGAVFAAASSVEITDSDLKNNAAPYAAALYAGATANVTLKDTIITENAAEQIGGGVIIVQDASASADKNTKIYNNTAGRAGDDIFLQSQSAKNPSITLYEVGQQEVNVTCGEDSHPIDGWYSDGTGARWNAHDSEKAYSVIPRTDASVPYTFTGTSGGSTSYALKAAHGYLIHYVLDDGTNHADNPTSYTDADDALPLLDPVKEGYIFGGWYSNANFTADSKITEIAADSQGDKTVYAQWLADDNNDDIPDKYQKQVSFEVENGTWDDGTADSITLWVTLFDADGNWSETGSGTLTDIPTDMEPNVGYDNGAWDTTPSTTVTGTDPVTFTYTFEEIPVPDGEIRYFVYHYKAGEDGTYPAEPTDIDLKSGKVGEQATGTAKDYEGYCLNTKDSITTGELVEIESIDNALILKFYYDKDIVGEDGPEPDGVPDKYQKEVTFEVENGTWDDGTADPITVWVTLTDENGDWSETGTGELTAPTGMEPATGYGNGAWDKTSPATVSGTDPVTYTYIFEELPVPDGEVKYYVEHYKADESGKYPTTPTEKEVPSGKVGDKVTGTAKTYAGFCVNTQISVTQGSLVAVETDDDIVVLKFYYDKDTVGEEGVKPDGIPDKYQKEVTFEVENGTWKDGTADSITVWVTLTDENGNWSETGTGKLTVPTGMKPETGYGNGAWDNTPPATVSGTAAVTYTHSFELLDVKLSYEKHTPGNPEETTEELPYGTMIIVDPNGGKYEGSTKVVTLKLTADTKLKTPTRSGYTFNGWKTSVDKETGYTVYTAQWTKIASTTPVTGDHSNIHMWTLLFVVSAAAVAALCLTKRPKGKYLRH